MTLASLRGEKGIIHLLLEHQASVNQLTSDGFPPLFIAAQNGHKDVVELLIKNRADVLQTNKNGAFPLFVAAENGHKDVVKILIENGADVHKKWKAPSGKSYSPFVKAISNKHPAIIKILLESGKLNIRDEIAVALQLGRNDIAEQIRDIFPKYAHYYKSRETAKNVSPEALKALTPEQRYLFRMGCDLEDTECPICASSLGTKKTGAIGIDGEPITVPSKVTLTSCHKALCPDCLKDSLKATGGKCPFCKQVHEVNNLVEMHPVPLRPDMEGPSVNARKDSGKASSPKSSASQEEEKGSSAGSAQ